MDSDERKAALLVEAQGMEVIICGNETQAAAAEVASYVFDHLDERGTNAKSRLSTINGHDFAVILFDVIGNQPDRLFIAGGYEPWEVMRVVDFTVGDNHVSTPMFDDELPDPVFVTGIEWLDRKICHALTSSLQRAFRVKLILAQQYKAHSTGRLPG